MKSIVVVVDVTDVVVVVHADVALDAVVVAVLLHMIASLGYERV